jgi:hypothetical protein
MSADKVFPSGAWRVSDIIGSYLVQRVYFGHTKREAMLAFRAEFKRGRVC